ncbi:AAA family ATPase [Planktosalinus lacus]|uniref:Mobilization protein n=1 Tax=Planktosalinus lacus TaxID=1526573 RepID=A0A8J2V973_9FLAO|nr:AAA family ATPase [Planktosalinus lacus]GGD86381.1 mobilization protein [Planktosalinus lacus]
MDNILNISKIELPGKIEFNPNDISKLLIDPNETIPPPPVAWCQMIDGNEIIMGTLGNFSVLIGKAKSKKSFLTGLITSFILKPNDSFFGKLQSENNRILYFDTEQGRYHCQKSLKMIYELCNKNDLPIEMYFLRSKNPEDRRRIINHLIKTKERIGFVIIDGIRDLVKSINDEGEAMDLSTDLLRWTEEKNIHILTVIHQNKGNDHARGHLGSELINKAETVLSVEKCKDNDNISIVKPELCRNKEPQPFAFEIINGLPVLVDDFEIQASTRKQSIEIEKIDQFKLYQMLTEVFSKHEEYSYQDLKDIIKETFFNNFSKKLPEHKCREMINEFKNNGWVIQEADRKPYKIGKYNDV